MHLLSKNSLINRYLELIIGQESLNHCLTSYLMTLISKYGLWKEAVESLTKYTDIH